VRDAGSVSVKWKYKMNQRLKTQIALITGAGTGIGAAIAEEMAKEGAFVVINYPSPEGEDKARNVLSKIIKNGGKGMLQQADISKENEVIQMFSEIIKTQGTIHILVNNAGIQQDAPLTEMTIEQWQSVIDVNLTGQFLCSREAVKEFLHRGVIPTQSLAAGKIICISSVHQTIPWAGHANYAASKGGVMLLMESIAQEFAPKKIRVNSICPGAIKTPINLNAWSTPAAEKRLLNLIPYGRVGIPSDIGKVAVWLASDESDYVNGTSLFVDGGMSLYPGFTTNG
jgi:glucose 1-dehydrogenase